MGGWWKNCIIHQQLTSDRNHFVSNLPNATRAKSFTWTRQGRAWGFRDLGSACSEPHSGLNQKPAGVGLYSEYADAISPDTLVPGRVRVSLWMKRCPSFPPLARAPWFRRRAVGQSFSLALLMGLHEQEKLGLIIFHLKQPGSWAPPSTGKGFNIKLEAPKRHRKKRAQFSCISFSPTCPSNLQPHHQTRPTLSTASHPKFLITSQRLMQGRQKNRSRV